MRFTCNLLAAHMKLINRACLLAVLPAACSYGGTVYSVETFSQSSYGFSADGTAAYNVPGSPAPNNVGAYFRAPAIAPAGATATGTTDTTGTLTAAIDQTFVNSGDAFGNEGSANAFANLATGFLGASISAVTGPSQPSAISVQATAQFSDYFNYTVLGADPSTLTPVTITFTLAGTTELVNGSATASWQMIFGNAAVNATIATGATACGFGSATTICLEPGFLTSGGFASGGFSEQTPQSIIFQGTYDLLGASGSLPVSGYLNVVGGDGNFAFDYYDPSQFNVVVPGNVSFTSASGVFLTQEGASGVPEPSSLLLLALGLIALGSVRRKTSRIR